MGKMLVLLLVILLAFASVGGYLFLTEKIAAGEKQIADGQTQLEAGRAAQAGGKALLETGKQELSEGKKEYEQAHDNPFLVFADKWFNDGKGFAEGRKQIAEGDRQVAEGEIKVDAGEKRIDAGQHELSRGMEQLKLARGARLACALAAVFFASLSIVLGFRWRRSLARLFM